MADKTMSVTEAVKALIAYGLRTNLIKESDAIYAANSVFDVLGVEPDGSFLPDDVEFMELEDILAVLLDDAAARGRIDGGIASRDLFDTRIMGCLTPRPSEVIKRFNKLYKNQGPKAATDYFYALSKDSDYIRSYRIKKDMKWLAPTRYGDLDITINLSKPEKDPKAIAAALNKKQNSYPLCLLCPTNTGYAGRLDHPARQTIRLIPLKLAGQQWYMQYSPYVYYNEHCIVLSGEHRPMKIERDTFARLLQFVTILPHYTVGSNADLPIVGGSILTHEHFQGGCYTFAMAKAPIRKEIDFTGYFSDWDDVTGGIVDWPMSVIRLRSKNVNHLVDLSDAILNLWRGYSDESVGIFAETDGTPHNTITPIARMHGDEYELDLVLRNNLTTDEHPLGVFHPHAELHHIKKENIGLIEVMGLAVLPARLKDEMKVLCDTVLEGKDPEGLILTAPHAAWTREILEKYPEFKPENVVKSEENAARFTQILKEEIGLVFAKVLEHCGVFKDDEAGRAAFDAFVEKVLQKA